jgi:hypothetical protein
VANIPGQPRPRSRRDRFLHGTDRVLTCARRPRRAHPPPSARLPLQRHRRSDRRLDRPARRSDACNLLATVGFVDWSLCRLGRSGTTCSMSRQSAPATGGPRGIRTPVSALRGPTHLNRITVFQYTDGYADGSFHLNRRRQQRPAPCTLNGQSRYVRPSCCRRPLPFPPLSSISFCAGPRFRLPCVGPTAHRILSVPGLSKAYPGVVDRGGLGLGERQPRPPPHRLPV